MGRKLQEQKEILKFETLQLHVGQEQPDPVTDKERCRSIRHHLMCSETVITQRQDSVSADAGNIYDV